MIPIIFENMSQRSCLFVYINFKNDRTTVVLVIPYLKIRDLRKQYQNILERNEIQSTECVISIVPCIIERQWRNTFCRQNVVYIK